VPDHQTPSLEITFRTRKDAEVAFVQGRHFKDRTLSVTWVAQGGQQAAAAPAGTEEAAAEPEEEEKSQNQENETEKDELDADGDVSFLISWYFKIYSKLVNL
jgi:RNA-binding protein 26